MNDDIFHCLLQSDLIEFKGEKNDIILLKMICFFLTKTQDRLKLVIGTFRRINLQFLTETIKTHYSYTMVLRTFYVK